MWLWSKFNKWNFLNLIFVTINYLSKLINLGRIKLLSKRVRFSCLLQQNVMWMKRFMKQIKCLKSLLQAPRECACLHDGKQSKW